MWGRERAWGLVGKLLSRVQRGCGSVLLVEGPPGMGKSSLLSRAAREATARGFELTEGAADEFGQPVPFAPLDMAFRARPGEPGRDGPHDDAPDAWVPEIGRLRSCLAERATRNPVLVSLDDLQWADQATLTALRTLPRALRRHRLLWILARSAIAPGSRAELLFKLLEGDGAVRVTLAPLAGDEVTGLLIDGFGSPPDEGLLRLAGNAGGNPELLSELVQGLREEHAVRIEAGRAHLIQPQPPRRIQEIVRNQLAGLGRQAQQFLEIAAVLGSSLSLEDAAEMLGESPAAALARVDEVLNAGVLGASAEALTFRYELVRQALAASLPAPVRRALHRQYGEMLLNRGSAAEAAAHLLQGARTGDHFVLARLVQAAEQVLAASPQTAAELAVNALRLTPSADADRFQRSVAASEALAAAGRVKEASDLVRAIPSQQLPPLLAARLSCARSAVACLRGQARAAQAEAEEVLAQPDLPAWLREEAVTARLKALVTLRGNGRPRSLAQAIGSVPARHGDHVAAGLLVVRSAVAWDDGRIGDGLELLREAALRSSRCWRDARHFQPQLAFAARLIDLRRMDEAATVIQAAAGETEVPGSIPAQVMPAVLRTRMNLALGRLDSAAAEAETALDVAGRLGADAYTSLARLLLAAVAVHRGALHDAGHHIAGSGGGPPGAQRPQCADVLAPAEAALAEPQVAEARDGPEAAMKPLRAIYGDPRSCRWILVGDPGAGPWLVRTAVAAREPEAASAITRLAESIATGSPEIGTMTTAAAHCAGILYQDARCLAQAASDHPDGWARGSAAEDLAVLLAEKNDEDGAACWLTRALRAYSLSGALRDQARVRARLRKLGVRPRHWAPRQRSVSGWESLTETECTASDLVALGLSNQEVADRMYVSVHTVAFHLRHVFRKLNIRSRAELTRLVIERRNGLTGG